MAKRFQTKVEKQAARARTEAHLGGEKKRTKGKAKAAAIKVNGAALDLSGGENPKAKAESIKLHFDELARMQKKADSGNASVRAQKALAKKDHVDTNLLAKVMKIADQDPRDAETEFGELFRYLGICVPEVQLEMFAAKNQTREGAVFDDAFRAGRDARKSAKDNPYDAGTHLHHIWADGYAAGQRKNASLIGTTAKVDSLGPVSQH